MSTLDTNSRKDLKILSPELGNSTLLEVADIAQNKLDFSLLCQHATSSIYVMGGFIEDSQHFIEKFDIQKGKWEIAGTFINNRTKFSSLTLPEQGVILIMGGKKVAYTIKICLIRMQEGARTAICEEYSLTHHVVTPSDIELTSPRSGFGAYLFKGKDLESLRNLIFKYQMIFLFVEAMMDILF